MEWWPIFWMFVVLKVPLLAALWIVWWALRAEPEAAEDEQASGGDGPHRPRPSRPRPPRRGPHAASSPRSPRRVRVHSRRRVAAHR